MRVFMPNIQVYIHIMNFPYLMRYIAITSNVYWKTRRKFLTRLNVQRQIYDTSK